MKGPVNFNAVSSAGASYIVGKLPGAPSSVDRKGEPQRHGAPRKAMNWKKEIANGKLAKSGEICEMAGLF